MGGFSSPGDYATFKFPPPSRHDPGIYAQAVVNAVIDGNALDGTADEDGAGVTVSGHATGETAEITVSNNRVGFGFAATVQGSKSTGTSVPNLTVTGNSGTDTDGTAFAFSDCDGLVLVGNSATRKAGAQTAGQYAYQISNCDDIQVSNNLTRGITGAQFARGMAVTGCNGGVVMGNYINGLSDPFYSIVDSGNTGVFFHLNKNPRQTGPMIGNYNVGNSFGSETSIRVTFGTSAPVSGDGYFAIGSIRWNLGAGAGGKAGWYCTAAGTPGTWKPFGAIDS